MYLLVYFSLFFFFYFLFEEEVKYFIPNNFPLRMVTFPAVTVLKLKASERAVEV